jgi:hypothetical protein
VPPVAIASPEPSATASSAYVLNVEPDHLLEEPIDYDRGAQVLRQARSIDDEVEVPYRSSFR